MVQNMSKFQTLGYMIVNLQNTTDEFLTFKKHRRLASLVQAQSLIVSSKDGMLCWGAKVCFQTVFGYPKKGTYHSLTESYLPSLSLSLSPRYSCYGYGKSSDWWFIMYIQGHTPHTWSILEYLAFQTHWEELTPEKTWKDARLPFKSRPSWARAILV